MNIKNKLLKDIVVEIINMKSLKDYHIETIDNSLYICLFGLSQLNKNNIVKLLNAKGFETKTCVTDRNWAMSYLPTTEIETNASECFNENLMLYDYFEIC